MKNLGRNLVIATLLGAFVYAGLAFLSDVRQLRQHLSEFRWWTFAGALVFAFGNYLLRFLKWSFYLKKLGIGSSALGAPFRPLPFGESFAIFLAGFVMSITPGKAGEIFKSALLSSARGVPVARSAPIVVAERLTDLLSLIILVAIGSALFPGYGWIALIASAMVATVLIFIALDGITFRLIDFVGRVRLGQKLAPRLREAYKSLRVMTSPAALVLATVISLFAWALECSALALILYGLHEPVDPALAFFAYATATIAGAIAMLPGGLGGTELTMRTMLHGVGGISQAAADVGTLLVRLATLWFAVGVGLAALAVFRRRYDRQAAVPFSRTTATASRV